MPVPSTLRAEYPILVTDAHTLGSLAVIRSLGRAGYPVHACSAKPDALGFRSRFAQVGIRVPDYGTPDFIDWLRGYVRDQRIRAIIPSEMLLLAIRGSFSEFSPVLPLSSSESIVYAGMSKADQLACMQSQNGSSGHLPPFCLLQGHQGVPIAEALEPLGLPLYIKVDGAYSRFGELGSVHPASSTAQAQELVGRLSARYSKVLVQSHVEGQGIGAFFLMWNGDLLAEFMHIRLHEVPRTGGVSSYRASWWHEGIREDALVKLKTMKWQGVAMMEYRWDSATDQFYFLEMNGRFWGSLHLALFAGVDFPVMLVDAFRGHVPVPVRGPSLDTRCRYTFPRDLMYVWSIWKDNALGWPAKFRAAQEFLWLGIDPNVKSDLSFPGDRSLYWVQLWRFLKELFGF